VGPSGCGKTSVLRMVAGLEEITGGVVRIGGRVVNDLLPKDRDIAMVFQNYALYPHMDVFDNMAFGLRQRRLPKAEIERRVTEAMTMGDRVAVMRRGVLQQVDGPQRLYERPANLFVAEFIGSPAMNLVEAELDRDGDGLVARFGEHRLRLGRRVEAAPGRTIL